MLPCPERIMAHSCCLAASRTSSSIESHHTRMSMPAPFSISSFWAIGSSLFHSGVGVLGCRSLFR